MPNAEQYARNVAGAYMAFGVVFLMTWLQAVAPWYLEGLDDAKI